MNTNTSSMNSWLKLALIISIFFGVANSLSAQPENSPQQNSDPGINLEKSTNNQNKNDIGAEDNQSPYNQQDKNNIQQSQTENKNENSQVNNESTLQKKPDQSPQSEPSINSKKNLTIKDILLFIDLPILATLLLLWFLTQNKQQQQIDKLINNQKKIIGNFNQFNDINSKLNILDRTNRQIIEKIQDNNQNVVNLNSRLPELLSKHQVNDSVNYHNNSTPDISHLNSIAIVDKIVQLAKTYNQDKNSLSNKAIATVAETQESLNQRRSGNSDTVTLENITQKKYCIIEEDNDYYLIPHAKIRIDEHNKTTLESLFDCTNFTSEYSDFQLVKPAKVSQIDSETWQLEKKGKLEFS